MYINTGAQALGPSEVKGERNHSGEKGSETRHPKYGYSAQIHINSEFYWLTLTLLVASPPETHSTVGILNMETECFQKTACYLLTALGPIDTDIS